MTEIKHPTLPVVKSVREGKAAAWLAAGWLLVNPPAPVEVEATEAAPEPHRPSRRHRKGD